VASVVAVQFVSLPQSVPPLPNDRDHPAAMGDLTILDPHTNRRSVYIAWFGALDIPPLLWA
jgi:hypothetical protein